MQVIQPSRLVAGLSGAGRRATSLYTVSSSSATPCCHPSSYLLSAFLGKPSRPGLALLARPLVHPARWYSDQAGRPEKYLATRCVRSTWSLGCSPPPSPCRPSTDKGRAYCSTTRTAPKTKILATKTLHEDIYTVPNLLTLSRLFAAPIVGYFILHDNHHWALGLLAYSAVTDVLDGWIARRWDKKTVVGTVIDPMADKALMAILTIALAIKGALPLWLATIILGRDASLGVAAIYYRWISLPPPKTFARYWDFSLPSAEVHPTTISKYNTFLQLALIGLTTAAPVVPMDLTTSLHLMQYTVAATTIWSGASYIYSKDAVKILNTPKDPPNTK